MGQMDQTATATVCAELMKIETEIVAGAAMIARQWTALASFKARGLDTTAAQEGLHSSAASQATRFTERARLRQQLAASREPVSSGPTGVAGELPIAC